MNEGFVDLRQNTAHFVEDSFWPSFTDIMTVVVMIFLIATSVLIVQNWELVAELQDSIDTEREISRRLKDSITHEQQVSEELRRIMAERQRISLQLQETKVSQQQMSQQLQASIEEARRTAEAVKQSSEVNATLEEQLSHLQSQMSMLRLELMQSREIISAKDERIVKQSRQIAVLNSEQQKRDQELLSKKHDIAMLNKKVNRSDTSIAQLRSELELQMRALTSNKVELDQRAIELADKQAELAALGELSKQQLQDIIKYKRQIADAAQQHTVMASEYGALEEKYNKLIRPARSAVGKYVVEVRYEKIAGEEKVRYRQSDQGSYQFISMATLYKKLDVLKAEYQDKLYVKVIIPDNSGLSYSEAWTFMSGILDKYDYYYQNK